MARYAAFLRGINVGGRQATSDQLRRCFEELGLQDVATFRASGNVVFSAAGKVGAAQVEQGLERSLGYDVAVFLRTDNELKAIAAHRPFPARRLQASKGKLQVALLPKKPGAAAKKKLLALRSDDDLFAFEARELYWLPSGGLMDSAVGMKGISDVLGPNTVRTKGTIEQMAEKYFGSDD
jgi:uncharacterized protein (DUF1697 family)